MMAGEFRAQIAVVMPSRVNSVGLSPDDRQPMKGAGRVSQRRRSSASSTISRRSVSLLKTTLLRVHRGSVRPDLKMASNIATIKKEAKKRRREELTNVIEELKAKKLKLEAEKTKLGSEDENEDEETRVFEELESQLDGVGDKTIIVDEAVSGEQAERLISDLDGSLKKTGGLVKDLMLDYYRVSSSGEQLGQQLKVLNVAWFKSVVSELNYQSDFVAQIGNLPDALKSKSEAQPMMNQVEPLNDQSLKSAPITRQSNEESTSSNVKSDSSVVSETESKISSLPGMCSSPTLNQLFDKESDEETRVFKELESQLDGVGDKTIIVDEAVSGEQAERLIRDLDGSLKKTGGLVKELMYDYYRVSTSGEQLGEQLKVLNVAWFKSVVSELNYQSDLVAQIGNLPDALKKKSEAQPMMNQVEPLNDQSLKSALITRQSNEGSTSSSLDKCDSSVVSATESNVSTLPGGFSSPTYQILNKDSDEFSTDSLSLFSRDILKDDSEDPEEGSEEGAN